MHLIRTLANLGLMSECAVCGRILKEVQATVGFFMLHLMMLKITTLKLRQPH